MSPWSLALTPTTDDDCWEDSVMQKEENDRNADAVARGKRPKPEDGCEPPDSPPPPAKPGERVRKSARVIAKVGGRR